MVDLAKVKRNVKRMVDQGADESEIDEYIALEGTTVEQVRNASLQGGGTLKKVGDFVRDTAVNAADMVSLGWNDEASSALAALPALAPGGESYGDAYRRHMTRQNAMKDRASRNTGAKVIGDTIGLAPAMLMTAGTGPTGSLAAQALRPAATAGGRIRQGAALGASAGGLKAGGDADQAGGQMALDMALGTGVGGLAGGAVSGAAEAVPRIASAAMRQLGLSKRPPLRQQAANRITDRAIKDGIAPENIAASVRQARKSGANEYAVIDAGGHNIKGLGRSTANQPGRGSDIMRTFAHGRRAGQYPRYISAIEDNLGKIRDPDAVRQAAKENAEKFVDPLYRAAHKEQMPLDPQLRQVLSRPSVRQAINESRKTYAEAGRRAPQVYDESGNVAKNLKDMSVEQVHYVREGIDRQIAKETLNDPTFSSTSHGRLLQQTRGVIDDYLKTRSPAMKAADNRYSTMMAETKALDKGYQMPRARPRDIAEFSASATAGQKAMYGEGARARMADDLGKMNDGRDISKFFMGTPNQRSALPLTAQTRKGADDFNQFLANERAMGRSDDAIISNSSTAYQQNLREAEKLPVAEAAGSAIRRGGLSSIRDGIAGIVERTGGITDAERQVIAEMLTGTSEEGLEEFLILALRRAAQQAARQQTVGPASVMGGYAAGATQ